jgi:hypothetical protein
MHKCTKRPEGSGAWSLVEKDTRQGPESRNFDDEVIHQGNMAGGGGGGGADGAIEMGRL